MATAGGSDGAEGEKVHKERPCPISLPVDHASFCDVIATMRHLVKQQYTEQREEFMDTVLKNTHEQRRERSHEQIDKDTIKLKKADPVLADVEPFTADWLPTGPTASIPKFPPREVIAARRGDHPLPPTEGLFLKDFMEQNDRLLAMSIEELTKARYIDAWMFKFALTRYFDLPDAAMRFLKHRKVIKDHDLTFTWNYEFGAVYNGNYEISKMYAEYTTNEEFELPLEPVAEEGFFVEGRGTSSQRSGSEGAAPVAGGGEKRSDGESNTDAPPISKTEAAIRVKHAYRRNKTPILIARGRYNDYSKHSMGSCKKAWFFFVSSVAASDYYEQTHGHVTCASGEGTGLSNLSREFANFSTDAVQTAMPVKVQRVFVCNQGWLFNTLIAPVIALLLGTKMRERLVTVSDAKYKEVVLELGADRVPPEFGGKMAILENSGDDFIKWLAGLVAYRLEPMSMTPSQYTPKTPDAQEDCGY